LGVILITATAVVHLVARKFRTAIWLLSDGHK